MTTPGIQIGKRYRLVIRPNPENRCPLCHVVIGEKTLNEFPETQGEIIVVREHIKRKTKINCPTCKNKFPAPEGMIGVEVWGFCPYAVPYTWLEPVTEEA